jgi:hypothetical protein
MMDGRDFLARTCLLGEGPGASVSPASNPVIGVSVSEGGPVGPVMALPHSFPKNPAIFNGNIGEWDGGGSRRSDSAGGSDVLYTLDVGTGWTGVLRIDRSRVHCNSRGRRASCGGRWEGAGNR